jgi:hypothetical protein
MKKVWLFLLLVSVLSLNTAGWLASAASMPCHMSQSHGPCPMDSAMLDMADCLQACTSHYPALPNVLPFAVFTAIKLVFSTAPVYFLPDPPLESPYKPPTLGAIISF